MKRGPWIILAALLAAIVGFVITQRSCCDVVMTNTAPHDGSSRLPELEWLRHEFKLTDAQFAKVSELHLAYRPTCEDLCMKVMASQKKIKTLVSGGTQVSPELTAALQEQAGLHMECQTALLTHLYQTAACLSPEQAHGYLDAMLPQVIDMKMEPATTHSGH
jgi:hypothetical protein